MVNIIENRALLTGTIISVAKDPDPKGFYEFILALNSTADLDDLPNLARNDEGREVTIRISKTGLEQINASSGAGVSIIARKAFGQIYFALEG